MRQKGFATILGLCLILVIAIIVKGIQDSEKNHVREIFNFEMEQALQNAAESGIVEAAEEFKGKSFDAGNIFTTAKEFSHGEEKFEITVKVFGERGTIYIGTKSSHDGIYFMSYASTESPFLSKKIYRRAYAYVLTEITDDDKLNDDTTINFMELPTQ